MKKRAQAAIDAANRSSMDAEKALAEAEADEAAVDAVPKRSKDRNETKRRSGVSLPCYPPPAAAVCGVVLRRIAAGQQCVVLSTRRRQS